MNAERLRDRFLAVLSGAVEAMSITQAGLTVAEYCRRRGRGVIIEEVYRVEVSPTRRGLVRRGAGQPRRGTRWELSRLHGIYYWAPGTWMRLVMSQFRGLVAEIAGALLAELAAYLGVLLADASAGAHRPADQLLGIRNCWAGTGRRRLSPVTANALSMNGFAVAASLVGPPAGVPR